MSNATQTDRWTDSPRARWLAVAVYAVAMAWVESAVVLYLRTLTQRLDPATTTPLPPLERVTEAELVREAATLIMLGAVGWLAGRDWCTRAGYGLLAFGLWDIFYYVFLKPLTSWPRSLLDWDVLFLLPLPWWGPVAAPVSVALLMVLWGSLVTQLPPQRLQRSPPGLVWVLTALGVVLALYVFMADAIRVAPQGRQALQNLLPTRFNWLLFGCAWLLMASPVLHLLIQLTRRQPAQPTASQPE
jgi:hypothetical protein